MDIEFSLPDETILLIEFLKLQDFFTFSFEEKQYEIVGKDDVGNFVGIDNSNQVFYLEIDPNNTRYIASDLEKFIRELMFYKEYIAEYPCLARLKSMYGKKRFLLMMV